MRPRRNGQRSENKKQRCQWGGDGKKYQDQQASKPGKDGRVSAAVAGALVTLER